MVIIITKVITMINNNDNMGKQYLNSYYAQNYGRNQCATTDIVGQTAENEGNIIVKQIHT